MSAAPERTAVPEIQGRVCPSPQTPGSEGRCVHVKARSSQRAKKHLQASQDVPGATSESTASSRLEGEETEAQARQRSGPPPVFGLPGASGKPLPGPGGGPGSGRENPGRLRARQASVSLSEGQVTSGTSGEVITMVAKKSRGL